MGVDYNETRTSHQFSGCTLCTDRIVCGGGGVDLFSEPCLISSTEDLSQRNQTTRVIVNQYEQDVLGESGMPTGETMTFDRRIIFKGDNLCYDAQDYVLNPYAEPLWQESVAAFSAAAESGIAYTAEQAELKVDIADAITVNTPIRCAVRDRGTEYVLRLGIIGLGYYDAGSGNLAIVRTPAAVAAEHSADRVRYRGIFGSAGDVEFIYSPGGLKQNLIISSLAELPTPESLEMNPDTTKVGIVSMIVRESYDCAVTSRSDVRSSFTALDAETALEGTQVAVDVIDINSGRSLMRFIPYGMAIDAGYEEAFPADMASCRTGVYRIFTQSGDAEYELFEGIAWTWLASEGRLFPVTLDYQIKTGTSTGSECWHEGVTYCIQDDYTIPDGHTLVIEGNAVVKQYPGKKIIIEDGARLYAQGLARKYCIITNAADTVGETIPNAPSGDGGGIMFEPTADTFTESSVIDHCKFHALGTAIDLYGPMTFIRGENTLSPIRHSIFRDCEIGVCYNMIADDDDNAVEILNCLMVDGTYGIVGDLTFYEGGAFNLELRNCTIDTMASAVHIPVYLEKEEPAQVSVIAKDCMFSNCTESIWTDNGITDGSVIDYNGYYECPVPENFLYGSNNVYPTSSPYKTSSNGQYYGAEWTALSQYQYSSNLVDAGEDMSSYPSILLPEIKSRTIFRPYSITASNINETTQGECSTANFRNSKLVEYYRDCVTYGASQRDTRVDIGFHYDAAHAVVSGVNPPTLTTDLPIDPGAVMAYAQSAYITVTSGEVTCKGIPGSMIQFTSCVASGDECLIPCLSDYFSALWFANTAPLALLDFIVVEHASNAIKITGTTTKDTIQSISNSVLSQCSFGVTAYNANMTLRNCLITGNNGGCQVTASNTNKSPNATLAGCTFDANIYGFWYDLILGDEAPVNLLIEDCLFTNHTGAALHRSMGGEARSLVRNNLFYNNDLNVTDDYVTISIADNNILDTNPLFCHRARAADGVTVLELDPVTGSINRYDGYYLSQRSGDASRRPLYLNDISNIGPIIGFNGDIPDKFQPISADYTIEVCVLEGVPGIGSLFNTLGTYTRSNGSGVFTDGVSCQSQPTAIVIHAPQQTWIGSMTEGYGTYVDITIAQDRTVRIYIPPFSLSVDETAIFWVAEDGSTYFSHSSHTCVFPYYGDGSKMDAWYALRWDTSSSIQYQPAYSAYHFSRKLIDEGQMSTPLDAGTQDLLNAGTTKTAVSGTGPYENIGEHISSGYNGCDPTLFLRRWASMEDDNNNPLDIGYHYGGDTYELVDGQYPNHVFYKRGVAARYPKQMVGKVLEEIWQLTGFADFTVQYWLGSSLASKTLFSGYHDDEYQTGVVFEAKAVQDLSSYTPEQKQQLLNEHDIRLRLGYALFRDYTSGIMQDATIGDGWGNGNDDVYKGYIINPDDPRYYYWMYEGIVYTSGNIRWKATSLSTTTLPYYRHRENANEICHNRGQIYVGVTMNLTMNDGDISYAYNPEPTPTPPAPPVDREMQDTRGKYLASVLRIYRFDETGWHLIGERINKIGSFDIDTPIIPETFPKGEDTFITTDIREMSLTVHEERKGEGDYDVSVYVFWLENTTSKENRLTPHYKLYGARINNAAERSGAGTGDTAPRYIDDPVLIDDLQPGTNRDWIVAEWDHWVRNNYQSLPQGFTGVPRLLYGYKYYNTLRSIRITLYDTPGQEGNIAGYHERHNLNNDSSMRYLPLLAMNRSYYHDPLINHGFAGSSGGCGDYTLALSGEFYDTDIWSDPRNLDFSPTDVISRPLGSPRYIYGKTHLNNTTVYSTTGEIDMNVLDLRPRATVNMYDGVNNGEGYRDMWLSLRNVYFTAVNNAGDPGPNWDIDGDGVTEVYDKRLEKNVRDPGDIIPTVIMKQIDP